MALIHTYQAGFCSHPECMVIKGGRKQICQFPAKVFLLQVKDRLWLWDTGYAEHFYDATKGIYQLYRRITPVTFDPSDAIVNQLNAEGIAIGDLSGLILSHFHADHIAGLKDFVACPSSNTSNTSQDNHSKLRKQSTTIIASKKGWDKIRVAKGIKALKQGVLPELIPDNMSAQLQFIEHFTPVSLPPELAPFNKGYELPDSNGEIILVELAGHAHGHFGAFVQTDTMQTSINSQHYKNKIDGNKINANKINGIKNKHNSDEGNTTHPITSAHGKVSNSSNSSGSNNASNSDNNNSSNVLSAWTLIASDSAWLPENYQNNIMPSVMANTIMADVGQYRHTLFKLHQLSINQPHLPILLSHS